MSNFMYALLNAVKNDQDSLASQQMMDSNTTNLNVSIEMAVYNWTSKQLSKDASAIAAYAKSHSNATNTAKMQSLNTQYQKDSTLGQTSQSQADTSVQGSQTQTGQDGQNLANKAQLAQTMTSVLSTLASMLMQKY